MDNLPHATFKGGDAQLDAAIAAAKNSDKPTLIACKTTIGYGAPTKAGTAGSHGAPLGANEIAETRKRLDWPHAPFEVPGDVLIEWRGFGAKGAAVRAAWERKLGKLDAAKRDAMMAMAGMATPLNQFFLTIV